MANKFIITEYEGLGLDAAGRSLQAPLEPSIRVQVLVLTAGVQVSEPFNPRTTLVQIEAETRCAYTVGEEPEATVNDTPMGGGAPRFIAVRSRNEQLTKISAILNPA